MNEPAPPTRRNPLLWIALIVVGLILFVFMSGEREDPLSRPPPITLEAPDETAPAGADGETDSGSAGLSESAIDSESEPASGVIERTLLVPPGMRAREYIGQLRSAGKPYPLSQVFDKAQDYRHEGSLADAHLLYFFAAREGHLPAIMAMAEMADPRLFRAQDSLLDRPDPVQAYKWYSKAADMQQPEAVARLDALKNWAVQAAESGDTEARQVLLNFQ